MDVAVTDWATSEMGPAGPISAKSASLIENADIFVAKRTKNWHGKHVVQSPGPACPFLFFPSAWSSSSTGMPLKQLLKHKTASTK